MIRGSIAEFVCFPAGYVYSGQNIFCEQKLKGSHTDKSCGRNRSVSSLSGIPSSPKHGKKVPPLQNWPVTGTRKVSNNTVLLHHRRRVFVPKVF